MTIQSNLQGIHLSKVSIRIEDRKNEEPRVSQTRTWTGLSEFIKISEERTWPIRTGVTRF